MWNWKFWKPVGGVVNQEDMLYDKHKAVLTEHIGLDEQFKTISVRGILVCYESGMMSHRIHLPESVVLDIRRKQSNVGVLVDSAWYEPNWLYDSVVDVVHADYRNKKHRSDETEFTDDYTTKEEILSAFKRALNHARINGKTELVIFGGPNLIYSLLAYMDNLEVYTNKLEALPDAYFSAYLDAILRATRGKGNIPPAFALNHFIVTKAFETDSMKFTNLINPTPEGLENV